MSAIYMSLPTCLLVCSSDTFFLNLFLHTGLVLNLCPSVFWCVCQQCFGSPAGGVTKQHHVYLTFGPSCNLWLRLCCVVFPSDPHTTADTKPFLQYSLLEHAQSGRSSQSCYSQTGRQHLVPGWLLIHTPAKYMHTHAHTPDSLHTGGCVLTVYISALSYPSTSSTQTVLEAP